MDSRVHKPQIPARIIIGSVLIGLLILASVLYFISSSGREIQRARMAGIVVQKEFVPAAERQITLSREGTGLNVHEKDGDYILTVDVKMKDGTTKQFNVWLGKAQYETIKVGDQFDVGPYVVPE